MGRSSCVDALKMAPVLLSLAALAAPAVPFLQRPDLSSAGQTAFVLLHLDALPSIAACDYGHVDEFLEESG